MHQTSMDHEIKQRIVAIKEKVGRELLILTHHYQRKEIVDLGDHRGDSFGLSRMAAADKDARFIVFCGVHFMAESAAILAQPHQTVQIPDDEAGCWMSDMADIFMLEKAWKEMAKVIDADAVTPMVYMNSDAALKAFCGRNAGIVCTSSNAKAAFRWAFKRREKIFFLPDQHLGHNTAHELGIDPAAVIVWNREKPLGGQTPETIQKAAVILWQGYCLVHTRFLVEHIHAKRAEFPDARIVVHPECTREVVDQADAVGSTSFIVNYARSAPAGSTIIIGTEVNLVDRLALEYPDKHILALHHSLCPNMFKIDLNKLSKTLENLGQYNTVTVPERIKNDARLALGRMLRMAA
ncbi:MAG: quinolinate synthase NadA [Desulfosarcinaceae bacterium]|jgi:quinolinate synthase